MFQLLLTIVKDLNEDLIEEGEDLEENIKRNLEQLKQQEDRGFMSYKEICSLCQGNGYITIEVKGTDEIKQCWLCESEGEKKCDTNTQ